MSEINVVKLLLIVYDFISDNNNKIFQTHHNLVPSMTAGLKSKSWKSWFFLIAKTYNKFKNINFNVYLKFSKL